MKILLVAATAPELAGVLPLFDSDVVDSDFTHGDHHIKVLYTGVGSVRCAVKVTEAVIAMKPDIVYQIGIAGAYQRDLKLGTVVQVRSEQEAWLGVEHPDARFESVFDAGLVSSDEHPFADKKMINPTAKLAYLPVAKGLTVQQVSGSQTSIDRLRKYYDADVETMEGAGFFCSCLMQNVAFHQIRAISNHVEPRNRAGWELQSAVRSLGKAMKQILQA